MLQTINSVATERTPFTLDFADRFRSLKNDVRMIELAVDMALKDAEEDDSTAIVMACRRLQADIDELADQVLPPLTEEQLAARDEAMAAIGKAGL